MGHLSTEGCSRLLWIYVPGGRFEVKLKVVLIVVVALLLAGCEPGNSVQHGDRTVKMDEQLDRIEKKVDALQREHE